MSEKMTPLQAAFKADMDQFFTDCLTPDRGYEIPVDNLAALMQAEQNKAQAWRDMAERLADKLGDFWLEHCPNAGRRKRDRDKCKCDICEAIQAFDALKREKP